MRAFLWRLAFSLLCLVLLPTLYLWAAPNAGTGGGGGGDALTSNPLSQFAATTSAQLKGVISNETGTDGGVLVFNLSPTLTTPVLNSPTLTTANLGTINSGVLSNGTVSTRVANDSSSSIANTAFVQQEINNADGTGISCSGGTCNATLGTSIDGSELTASINILTTGTIQGLVNVSVLTDPNTVLAAADLAGSAHICNHASGCFYELPAVTAGLNAVFYDLNGGGIITLKPDGSDIFYLNGTEASAGVGIESPGAIGDFVGILALDSEKIVTLGMAGTWVEETP